MNRIISNADDLNFEIKSLDKMPIARRILMVKPTYFHVDNPINPHMKKPDGSRHILDKKKALAEWEKLREMYRDIGLDVVEVSPVEGLPDMVFCANQSLPSVSRTGELVATMSNMANDVRHLEVPAIAKALQKLGYKTQELTERSQTSFFEGMGDALWLPGYRVLLGGYGYRTHSSAYEKIADLLDVTVLCFELINPRFYHLDTCLSVLDESTALACREAFTDDGWQLLTKVLPRLVEVPLSEADSPGFACNAHCPDGRNVLIQEGSPVTVAKLKALGFRAIELSTEEFIKSGGSVFCMKLQFF